jgi:hypothetical protein
VGNVRGIQDVFERMKVAVAARYYPSMEEAQLADQFDDQMMQMMVGARRTRARLVEELELARQSGDADRQLLCTYYINEAEGLISLITHVVDTTPASIAAEVS